MAFLAFRKNNIYFTSLKTSKGINYIVDNCSNQYTTVDEKWNVLCSSLHRKDCSFFFFIESCNWFIILYYYFKFYDRIYFASLAATILIVTILFNNLIAFETRSFFIFFYFQKAMTHSILTATIVSIKTCTRSINDMTIKLIIKDPINHRTFLLIFYP